MKLIYVAHIFSGEQCNAERAEKLTAILNGWIQGAVFICPWLPMVRHWVDSGETRARGLQLDLECVRQTDGLLALTPLVGGVLQEWDVAENKVLCDTTAIINDVSPDWTGFELIQSWVDSLNGASDR